MAHALTPLHSHPGLWRIVRRFWPQIRKQRPLLIVSVLALLAEIVLHLLEPWPLKFIFDRIIMVEPGEIPAAFSLHAVGVSLETHDPIVLLTLAALAIVVISGLRATAAYFSTVGLALAGNRALAEVRSDLYRHLQRLSLSFHTKSRSGDLLTRVIGDVGRLQEVTITAILPLLVNCLTLVGMLGLMFWLNWQLALVALAVFPLFLLSLMRLSGRIRSVARHQRQREGAMAAAAAESISAIKVVQALSLETTLEQTFSSENAKNLSEGVKGKRLAAGLERTVDVITAVGTALALWYGVQLVLGGELTSGELLVFIAYLKSAFKPMRDLAKYTGRIAQATASGERVLDVLDAVPDIRDRPNAVSAPAFRGAVRFENVSFAYESGHPTLEKINFELHPGQQVALVGPSGSGKSTLVSLFLRLYDPQEGQVIIDGCDIRDYKLESLRSQVGMVLQESLLFAVSARDNIAYGWLDATDSQIEAAARLANAHDFITALPQGYNTILGERGATLSGGERQRIAIARAAVRRAPLLIFDEPTTGLDRENERAVNEALDRLAQGRTTFRIVHDLHSVEKADLILYLDDGRVVERGTHDELMRMGGPYAAMVALHAERTIHNDHVPPSQEASHALTS